jgi:acyl carrier protein
MQLETLFATVLDIPTTNLDDQSSPKTVASWNSLGHLKLITAMEELYGVTFSSAEIRSLKSLGSARAILQAKGAIFG